MSSSRSFEQFYNESLQPLATGLEGRRLEVQRMYLSEILPVGLAILFFLLATSRPESQGGFVFLAVVCAIAAGILLFLANRKRKRYVAEFKESIVREIIEFINPSFEYRPQACVNETDYKNSGLYLTDCDRYDGDDFVSGEIGDTKFCFSELHTEYRVQSGKNSHWETIFKGMFFIADFNKNFSGRTYVWNENSPQLNFLTKIFSGFASQLEKVSLESPEFEKRFIVYSTDQVEARYILSPSLMERMTRLYDKLCNEIVFSFVNTNVYVAIPMRDDLFEPAIFSPPGLRKMSDYYYTVQIVFELVEELNLNLRIWNKV